MQVRNAVSDLEGKKGVVVGLASFLFVRFFSSSLSPFAFFSFLSSHTQEITSYFGFNLRWDGVSQLTMTLGWEINRWIFFFFFGDIKYLHSSFFFFYNLHFSKTYQTMVSLRESSKSWQCPSSAQVHICWRCMECMTWYAQCAVKSLQSFLMIFEDMIVWCELSWYFCSRPACSLFLIYIFAANC